MLRTSEFGLVEFVLFVLLLMCRQLCVICATADVLAIQVAPTLAGRTYPVQAITCIVVLWGVIVFLVCLASRLVVS